MNHDPMHNVEGLSGALYDGSLGPCRLCEFAARVRADERAKFIATMETLAVGDVDGVMYIGERLDHILEAVSLATGGLITPDMPAPQIGDGCVLPSVGLDSISDTDGKMRP